MAIASVEGLHSFSFIVVLPCFQSLYMIVYGRLENSLITRTQYAELACNVFVGISNMKVSI